MEALGRVAPALEAASHRPVAGNGLRRVAPEQDGGHGEHEQAVEHEQVDLVAHQHAVVAHAELDHAEDGADKDQHAAGVQGVYQPPPGSRDGKGARRRVLGDAGVEDDGGDHEEAKEEDLDAEAAQDDGLAELLRVARLGLGHEAAACDEGNVGISRSLSDRSSRQQVLTATLQEEGKYVARHENLRHPRRPDQGIFVGVEQTDQPAEDHVDRGGHERGAEQDEEVLQDVGVQGEVGRLVRGDGSSNISDCLDCVVRPLSAGDRGLRDQDAGGLQRTCTPHNKGDEIPCPRACQDDNVPYGDRTEEDDEDDIPCETRIVAVELEVLPDGLFVRHDARQTNLCTMEPLERRIRWVTGNLLCWGEMGSDQR